jgi:hypothetical protein
MMAVCGAIMCESFFARALPRAKKGKGKGESVGGMSLCVVADLESTGLTLDDPEEGAYDYELQLNVDLNAVLSPFLYRCYGDGHHATWGESEAYAALHQVLRGDSPQSADQWLTKYGSSGVTSTSPNWALFWVGLLSEATNPADTAGLSIKTSTLAQVLSQPATRLPANDVSGLFNAAFGDSFGGADGVAVPIPPEPNCGLNYLAALARFLYGYRGYLDGSEGSLASDPTLSPSTLALLEGDVLAFRLSCSVNVQRTGIIRLVQSAA